MKTPARRAAIAHPAAMPLLPAVAAADGAADEAEIRSRGDAHRLAGGARPLPLTL